MQVEMNKCFLNPDKKMVQICRIDFEGNCINRLTPKHSISEKNATEPKAI